MMGGPWREWTIALSFLSSPSARGASPTNTTTASIAPGIPDNICAVTFTVPASSPAPQPLGGFAGEPE